MAEAVPPPDANPWARACAVAADVLPPLAADSAMAFAAASLLPCKGLTVNKYVTTVTAVCFVLNKDVATAAAV